MVKKRSKGDEPQHTRHASGELPVAITNLLNEIKSCLESLEGLCEQDVHDVIQRCRTQKVNIPFFELKDAALEARFSPKFTFVPPTNFAVVGSFLLNMVTEPAGVDLAVEIPAQVFCGNDELSYRYFFKRALYLGSLAGSLRTLASLKGASFSWCPFRGHLMKPILVIKGASPNITINIHAFAAPGTFKLHRFGPGKNLVRKDMITLLQPQVLNEVDLESLSDAPTPIYNSLVLSDLLMVEHLKLLNAECKRRPGLVDAIKMTKAWGFQRGYRNAAFSLSGFQAAMLMAFLSHTEQFEGNMSEVQMFRTFLKFLTVHDFGKVTAFGQLDDILRFVPIECKNDYTTDAYTRAATAVLIEPIAGLNILFDWTVEFVELLKMDAQRTIEMLEGRDGDWDMAFLLHDAPLDRFDAFYEIKDFNLCLDATANFAHYANEFIPQVSRLKMAAKKLRYALNTRSPGIFIQMPLSESSALSKPYPPQMNSIHVGLTIDRNEGSRIVELGPEANTEEAKAFRHFWQALSELRRFPDGSIREAVTWDRLKDRRHLIIREIVDFVSSTHLKSAKPLCLDGSLDFAWSPNTVFTDVNKALSDLAKALKSLEGLPLGVMKVEPLSPFGRMTSLDPPRGSNSCPSSAIDCLVHFEESSRWPQDYYGLIYARRALAAQLCRNLRTSWGLSTSMTDDYFDVECSGFVFRCYIFVETEVSLTRSQGLDWKPCELRNIHLPKHARKILALAQANSVFGPACRLFKKWVAALLYSEQIHDELAELLVAHVFVCSSRPPNTVESAFYRILRLLHSFPWADRPLITVLDAESEHDHVAHASCKGAADSAICVLAQYGPEPSLDAIWSERCKLSRTDLEYLQKLAKTAMGLVGRLAISDLACLFRTSASRFDIAINLLPISSLKLPQLAHKYLEGKDEEETVVLRSLPGFDPQTVLFSALTEMYNGVMSIYRGDADLIGMRVTEESRTDISSLAHQIESSFPGLITSVAIG